MDETMDERPLSTSDLAGTSADGSETTHGQPPVSGQTPAGTQAAANTEASTGADAAVAAEPGGDTPDANGAGGNEPLLAGDQAQRFRSDWSDIQAGFVDEPRESVQKADALVADLMQRLASEFAGERQNLETQWDRGDDVNTEDLRLALQRYRSFFDRLLAA
jgi:hypothetical protein